MRFIKNTIFSGCRREDDTTNEARIFVPLYIQSFLLVVRSVSFWLVYYLH